MPGIWYLVTYHQQSKIGYINLVKFMVRKLFLLLGSNKQKNCSSLNLKPGISYLYTGYVGGKELVLLDQKDPGAGPEEVWHPKHPKPPAPDVHQGKLT